MSSGGTQGTASYKEQHPLVRQKVYRRDLAVGNTRLAGAQGGEAIATTLEDVGRRGGEEGDSITRHTIPSGSPTQVITLYNGGTSVTGLIGRRGE